VAEANLSFQPQDLQAAVLLGAGIDPFADGNLQVGELTSSLQGATHAATAAQIRQSILGVA